MINTKHMLSWLVILLFVTACGVRMPIPVSTSPATEEPMPAVEIVRHPEPADFSQLYLELTAIPKFDPNSTDLWQVDLRSRDLTKLDISNSLADLMYADFDSKTQWPTIDKMPAAFDWQKIMEFGEDPGLGVKAVHDRGITGKGIGIAIIDQTLLVDHIEYKDRIRVYEEAADITDGWLETQMHGPAVASIAVGRTVGVAPEADLYYIATGDCGGATTMADMDFSCRAKAIRRIVEINATLPADRKIRVLSLSWSWKPTYKGYDEMVAAVNEAKTAGIFVISTNLDETYGLAFHGLGRDPLADPNSPESYFPGIWWANAFYSGMSLNQTLLVPMDSRTTASPTGINDYVFYREGGWSWCIPYLAGMYALAAQVKPEITPEEFWHTALRTGTTVQIVHGGKRYSFGAILDPQAMMAALQKQ